MKSKIYLDVCCLSRPFDDQTQDRVQLESNAIEAILSYLVVKDWIWVGSEIIDFEIRQIRDINKKMRILNIIEDAHQYATVGEEEVARAKEIKDMGFGDVDALHLACAELHAVDIFLTTDDKLLNKAKKRFEFLKVKVANPLEWFREVI